MDFYKLNNVLEKSARIEPDKIINRQFNINNLSLLKLRDYLILMGKIHYESVKDKIYIVSIKGGFFKMNSAILAAYFQTDKLMIAVYAKEGIINQHTCEGVINEFEKKLSKYIV